MSVFSIQKRKALSAGQVFFRLAWLFLALAVSAAHLASIPHLLSEERSLGWEEWSLAETQAAWSELGLSLPTMAGYLSWLDIVVPFFYISFALFLFSRKPGEMIVVLMATTFLLFSAGSSLGMLSSQYAWLATPGLMMDVLTSIITFAAIFLFPDGKTKPGWVRWAILFVASIQVWRLFNPAAYEAAFALVGGTTFTLLAAALFQRYTRHSNASERRQIKWVVFGLVAFFSSLGIYLVVLLSNPRLVEPSPAGVISFLIGLLIWMAFALVFPITVLIAMLRSQLWDVDVVIRRTLVYAAVSLLLGVFYLGAVTVLQNLFTAATGQSSPVALVVSTLGIAALFTPLRRRIQAFIDRRFYRQKYNAEQALAGFAALARSETDLNQLAAALLNLARETMQPDSIALWVVKQDNPLRGSLERTS